MSFFRILRQPFLVPPKRHEKVSATHAIRAKRRPMKTRYSILSALSLAAFAATAFVGGCSSDDAASTLPTTVKDAGTTKDATAATDSGSTTADAGTTPTVDAGSCSNVSTLHPPSPDAGTATIYCPFSSVGDAGNQRCQSGTQHCCETPSGSGSPSSCESAATPCAIPRSVDWGCQDPVADCKDGAKPVCCAAGATIGLGAPGCGNFARSMTGTACVAASACTGIVMCTDDSECPAGKTCIPFSKAGAQVGGCN